MSALQTVSEEIKMMGKRTEPNIKVEHLIETSSYFYQSLLGYSPEQTSLESIPDSDWNNFAQTKGLNPNSSGVYLPRNQTAVIQEQNPLSLFHEYFGHGLYCEQSLSGRKLVNLEKKLLEEEKQEFSFGKFTLEDVQRFRDKNNTFQKLDEFRKQNLLQYETFAIWTEYLLSGEHNLKDKFGKKYDSLSGQKKESIDSVINFSEQYGNLATFYASGLARRTTAERVGKLLEGVYGSKLEDVKFALLYGSKKEFSDIDVFMVGKDILRIKNDWVDVVSYSLEEFEDRRKLFDVEITDPLFSGEIIFGNKTYFEQQRRQLQKQQITEEAIKHNLKEAEEQEKSAYDFPKNSEWEKIGLSYAKTSRLMAESLKQGKRIFTEKDLLHSYRASAEDDKPLQFQGGKK